MARYYFDKKIEADGLKKVNISFLKKYGYLMGWGDSGNIKWSRNGEPNGDVGVRTSTSDLYLEFKYTQTDKDSGDKQDFEYKIPLTTTDCYFGGKRYWFVCPFYKNRVYCGKRVGVLYKTGDYFTCRHCGELTYESCNRSGMFKTFPSKTTSDLDKMRESIRSTHYKGKLTKKYAKYLHESERLERALFICSMMLK